MTIGMKYKQVINRLHLKKIQQTSTGGNLKTFMEMEGRMGKGKDREFDRLIERRKEARMKRDEEDTQIHTETERIE